MTLKPWKPWAPDEKYVPAFRTDIRVRFRAERKRLPPAPTTPTQDAPPTDEPTDAAPEPADTPKRGKRGQIQTRDEFGGGLDADEARHA